jgi:hypothetical protein
VRSPRWWKELATARAVLLLLGLLAAGTAATAAAIPPAGRTIITVG